MPVAYDEALQMRKRTGNLRSLKASVGLIDFASNDYLGFARDSQLSEKMIDEWRKLAPDQYQFGSTGSRLLTGHHPIMDEIESIIAETHHAEEALLFNSGYTANMGLISTIAKQEDVFFYDAHVHASAHDGMQLSRARTIPWRHNDTTHLEQRLKSINFLGNAFVLIESVYSCDGSIAPIQEICRLCDRYRVRLIVDEAHATGIIGDNGTGLVSHLQCGNNVFARIHTFSKALGIYGAAILCSTTLKNYLINFCRPLIYATALPIPILIGIKTAYAKLEHTESTRLHLNQLIRYFKEQETKIHLRVLSSDTPIQAILIPGNLNASSLANFLRDHGIDARALLSPTVKRGTERLRICIHAFNSQREIDLLIKLINSWSLCTNLSSRE